MEIWSNIGKYRKIDMDVESMYPTHLIYSGYGPEVKEVIFSPPATIVYWEDETRTVVKCQEGDVFNEEAGLAFCILKKLLGNKSNWNNYIRKLTDSAKRYNYPETNCDITFPFFDELMISVRESIDDAINSIFEIEDNKNDNLLSPEELVENNKDFESENYIVVDINDELIKKIATKDEDALSINIPATCRQCKHHTHLYGTQKTICAKSDDNLDVTQCTRGRSKKCPVW